LSEFPEIADLQGPAAELAVRLSGHGFADPAAAAAGFLRLAAAWCGVRVRSGLAEDQSPRWYGTLLRVLREAPLKDAVLSAVDEFVRRSRGEFDAFALFDRSPRALEVLARLACGSPFLTQTLLSDPQCLASLSLQGRTAETKDREQFVQEAAEMMLRGAARPEKLRELRRYHRRQLLRIGMCDAFGLMDLRFITLQLSLLADAMVQSAWVLAAAECGIDPRDLSVLALGKLGGEELNYSSDVDLVLIAERNSQQLTRAARLMVDALTDSQPPGFLYRVDLRLRPWGEAGELVSTPAAYAAYLSNDAELWEKQALLKARVIAGSPELGWRFLTDIRPLLFTAAEDAVRRSVHGMKSKIEQRLRQRGKLYSEVKLGAGSIRDVEFLVQSLQLIHGGGEPRIVSSNTLDALVRLAEFGLIPGAWYRQLRAGYVFLRSVEHSLQLLHNQQTHELPSDPGQLEWLAHRLDYPDAATLMARYEEHRRAVRMIFEQSLDGAGAGPAVVARPGLDGVIDRDSAVERAVVTADDDLLQRYSQLAGDLGCAVDARGGCALAVAQMGSDGTAADLLFTGIDFSGWLGVICGLLSICRLDIRSGDAATGDGLKHLGMQQPVGRYLACFRVAPAEGRFRGVGEVEELASGLEQELARLGGLSRAGRTEDVRAELLSRFCDRVSERRSGESVSEYEELQVDLRPIPDSVLTEVRIQGTDSPGFLYELMSALSLSRFRVLRAVIRSDGMQVRDVLYVRERDGQPISSEERRQELKLAATLIKQFTHWLPSAGDPQHALLRFRELVSRLQPASAWADNMRSLQRPRVLHAIARVLGISQYLWETFLRSRHDELFPLLAQAEQLAERRSAVQLEQELAAILEGDPDGSAGSAARWSQLNDFKDRHLFRIDMRHVLGYCRPFGAFSQELTELAELVVRAACRLAFGELEQLHGRPQLSSGSECLWMAGGLGKFGGVELGFASDIELLMVYEGEGRTLGRQSISNAEFFERMVRSVASGILAPQDGIFHVDLRMRPYGQAGPAAVRFADFVDYYGEGGPAWPYERQSLVRLRAVAGDAAFGHRVCAAARETIYRPGRFDFAAMQAMRERQIRQLVRGGTIHVKLSEGGLVDCEYAVQSLQLLHGGRLPCLQQTSTLEGLRAAATAGLVSAATAAAVEGAYMFLRELADCLRMVRGNARDLTLPEPGSRDWKQLDRRMTSIHDSEIPLTAVEQQMATVREFARQCATIR
jgi:glutamate-ammonia-ligase adenylyltransferase